MVIPRLNPIVHLSLAAALVLRGKGLSCRRGGSSGCNPSWAQAGLFLRPLGSAKPIISSDAIQEVAQRRKEQVGACGGCHMRLCLCCKCVWFSGKWSAWLWRAAASSGSDESFTGLSVHGFQFRGHSVLTCLSKWVFLRPAHHVEAPKNQRVALAQGRRAHFDSFSFTLRASSTQLLLGYFHSRRGKSLLWWTWGRMLACVWVPLCMCVLVLDRARKERRRLWGG